MRETGLDVWKVYLSIPLDKAHWEKKDVMIMYGFKIPIKQGDMIIVDKDTNTFFNDLKYLLK